MLINKATCGIFVLIPYIKKKTIRRAILYSMLLIASLTTCVPDEDNTVDAQAVKERDNVILKSVKFREKNVVFYINFGTDSAVLGFSVNNDTGKKQYCPMYASTYRGLPAVNLHIFVSTTQEELWVQSSWQGYESLAYHHIKTNHCITGYGELTLFDKPIQQSLSGSSKNIPKMDIQKVSKIATIPYKGNAF